MRHIYTILLLALAQTTIAQIPGYTLLVHYPLSGDASDATGVYGDVILENAPFQDGGVYSNGIYNDGTTNGSIIRTPNISAMNPNGFMVTCQYKIDDMPTMDRPVLIIGSSWRWLAVWTDMTGNGQFKLIGNDGSEVTATGVATTLGTWADLKVTYSNGTAELDVDGIGIGSLVFAPNHNADYTLSCDHGGSGVAYKGLIRNIKVYNADNVGISEADASADIRVFPNPVINTFRIESIRGLNNAQVDIFDLTGRMIHTQNVSGTYTEIDMAHLYTGMYYVRTTDTDGEVISINRIQKL